MASTWATTTQRLCQARKPFLRYAKHKRRTRPLSSADRVSNSRREKRACGKWLLIREEISWLFPKEKHVPSSVYNEGLVSGACFSSLSLEDDLFTAFKHMSSAWKCKVHTLILLLWRQCKIDFSTNSAWGLLKSNSLHHRWHGRWAQPLTPQHEGKRSRSPCAPCCTCACAYKSVLLSTVVHISTENVSQLCCLTEIELIYWSPGISLQLRFIAAEYLFLKDQSEWRV